MILGNDLAGQLVGPLIVQDTPLLPARPVEEPSSLYPLSAITRSQSKLKTLSLAQSLNVSLEVSVMRQLLKKS